MKKYTLEELPVGFVEYSLPNTFFHGRFMVSYLYVHSGESYYSGFSDTLKIHIL